MRLGVIKGVSVSGERVLLDVQIDAERHREVILLHPLGVRIRVAAGDRVLIGQIEENGDALFAWPITISREVEPAIDIVGDAVLVRSSGGTASALASKADVDALTNAVNTAIAIFNAGQAAAIGAAGLWVNSTPMTTAPAPIGTTVLKGE